ncbi:hypothetical protein [Kocuria oxytropis]|uniref:hypothetical protein n=1 Tax=Kocuria oxytropis TaxID=3058913 RepID=UPI0034D3ED33
MTDALPLWSQPPLWLHLSDDEFEETYRAGDRRGYLHRVLVRALSHAVERIPTEEELRRKPLTVEFAPPLPSKLSFYMYEATQHASERQQGTFKVQLTGGVRRSSASNRLFFDRSAKARVILAGYHPELRLFIIWDADLHELAGGFPYSKNVQAPPEVASEALARGLAHTSRRLKRPSVTERIVAARPRHLDRALQLRIQLSVQTLLEENL